MDENAISETEIPPKQIINQMKLNIFQNYNLYNNSLINLDYLLYRPSIFSLIQKISNRIGFKSQTYFLSIYYLDILHIKHQKIDLDLKLLSLACLSLSAKYVEIDKNVPNLPFFVAIFNSLVEYNDIISIQELIFAEVLTCQLLEYKLNYYTIYDFDSFFFGHGIIKIDQLKELNNNNNYFNDINHDINDNSLYIRKILEKIYRKSRFYLDKIVYNGNICLKYSSLIISVVIMKQSVEDILIGEKQITDVDINDFKEKTSECFKEIMKEIYQIDYESSEEYQNLILDNDVQNIFKEKNRGISDYINDKNLKYIPNKKDILINNRNQNLADKISNRKTFIKKLNISQNIDKYNFRKQNESGVESEEGDLLYFNRYRKERISVPKRYINQKPNLDIVKFNSTFSNNFNHSKRNKLNEYMEETNRNKIKNISLNNRHSEINGLINYVHTYTNDFYPKTRKNSDSIYKLNIKNIKFDNSLEETKGVINTFGDNNITLPNENILNSENVKTGKYYEKYKKLVLKKRFLNRINIHNRFGDYSISQLDNSNTMKNKDTFDEKNPIHNFNKPYYKKIIKNITNFSTKQNSKVISFFSTVNNNMYNTNRIKKNRMLLLNPFPYNNNNSIEKELNIDNTKETNENKANITLDAIKSNEQRNIITKKILNKKEYIYNQKKKVYSNNILLNSMTVEDKKEIKKEKEDILLTTNDDYINKKNERKKLLFNRMKDINNKIDFKNTLNNTEIKNNENSNKIPLKTKFIILNNKIKKEIVNIPRKDDLENNNIQNKDKIYENQIVYKNEINKINMNKVNNNVIKEINQKSLRFKYLNKRNFNENIQEQNKKLQKEIKKEYTNYPNSTIMKLINKTKRMNENKLNLSKEELNSSLINNFKNINKNKRNKIINTIDINQLNNTITETKNIPNIMFNTIDNDATNDKKEKNIEDINIPSKNTIHGYHYRNYMKNRIKKDKDADKNKNENSKTIVINNNININFNNKIENSKIYPNKNEIMKKQVTTKMGDSKVLFNKIIINKNNGDYNKRETIEYINNNGSHNKVSSLMPRLPFYKKASEYNKNKFSKENDK